MKRRKEDDLYVTKRQARWYRFRNSGLGTEKFSDAKAAAHRLVGLQAQMVSACKLAISSRLSQDFLQLDSHSVGSQLGSLVRVQAQRGTLHAFDPTDWCLVHAAVCDREIARMRRRYEDRGKKNQRPNLSDLDAAVEAATVLLRQRRTVSKTHLHGMDVAAYGALLTLCVSGQASRVEAGDRDAPTLVARSSAFPDVHWQKMSSEDAMSALALRFFRGYGPASIRDFQSWCGSSMEEARLAVRSVSSELQNVEVEGEDDHGEQFVARGEEMLLSEGAPDESIWPVRLLGCFDPLLLAHSDKTIWIESRYKKRVWSHTTIRAVVIVDGIIRGTWTKQRTADRLHITIEPFERIPEFAMRALDAEASRVGRTLGAASTSLQILRR
mmetsp:Transcript_570/g.1927  ORF Transcript_570/g.1927 Transcript_570/m.1927 type:complete len:383 (-) Transcript_570:213-1361(-)|eukprot:CAMPEP_0198736272 /NCGR_PEP_ID=MMETSP1475-20131203/64630_1 /TAXON_ID= ORGANISM="Unidentified sp., Strain CCMP1999" /NCGR_SAMPLE_ID=MMETSP1475 /ASSEMBLY_ACC=CAM_ASM_001111 /LENGTH=382 /DNA_ID=CAMNT_0044500051 /DNA_START=147 /DNA_END=1295 /DNA_ORIENTATION=+